MGNRSLIYRKTDIFCESEDCSTAQSSKAGMTGSTTFSFSRESPFDGNMGGRFRIFRRCFCFNRAFVATTLTPTDDNNAAYAGQHAGHVTLGNSEIAMAGRATIDVRIESPE